MKNAIEAMRQTIQEYDTLVGTDGASCYMGSDRTHTAGDWLCSRMHNSIEAMREIVATDKLQSSAPALLAAMRKIAKGEGRFNRDQLTHASNTVDDMKKLAANAIAKAVTI